ncbi:Wzz/FepE/Etk N-terminal domain-containing protein [Nocardioides rubriscoriae]|uniref:Wzz/FepE/Etk N-terminal domain-containing protein n=1 Tax=Nocardioides rubriscoriae TaxID=642762 RepID=UPI0011DF86A6|nr:Wzz/FepE/Etk N-terminal domain-containing protein [Nocardioides rubriscoriae]
MDLLEHAAGVWARRWVVLVVALAAAAAVLVWRSTAPDQYVAQTTVQVRLPEDQASDPSVQVGYYADTVVGLTTSRGVLEKALTSLGRPADEDAVSAVSGDVTAESGTQPGFVTVAATGADGVEAADLADAVAAVLATEVAADQADDLASQRAAITDAIALVGRERREVIGRDNVAVAALEREREALLGSLRAVADRPSWRLAVVEPATIPDGPASPKPLRDALLALIVALVLAAEGVVLARALRGSLSARDPGRDAAATAGVPAVVIDPDDGPTAVASLLPVLEGDRAVNLVQLGDAPQARAATLVARLLAARGDDVLLVDVAPQRPTVDRELGLDEGPGLTGLARTLTPASLDALPQHDRVRVLTAGAPAPGDHPARVARVVEVAPQSRLVLAASVDDVDDLLDVSSALSGPTVLAVDAGVTRKRLREAVTALRGLGLDVVAVTVHRGQRRSSRAPRAVARQRVAAEQPA